jgi:DNA-binding beta-propeller fold protein YncE
MPLHKPSLIVVVGLTSALAVASGGAADAPYHQLKEVAIGGEGGWDYLNVDSGAKRLYVSHGTKVVVVDTGNDSIVGEIADTPGVHGAIAAWDGKVVTSNGRENKASIVDAATLKTIQKVDTEANPDFIMFEPKQKEVYTFNGGGKSASVIDASGKVVATIPLGGKPEAGVPDPAAGRVYVNNETGNEIIVIDVAKHEVAARWPIAPGESAAGLAIDAKNHRLFIGAHNNKMLMMDSTNGKIVADVPIGAGVDATWFDPGTGYAFSSCGDGTTTIAHEDSPDKLTVVQKLETARGARTMALDPATHKIYLAAARYQPQSADAPANARPQMIPGSMYLLVYGMEKK